MKTTKNKIVVLILFLLTHLSIYAQYSGGDSDGSGADAFGTTSCATPTHFYAYFGGISDGSGSETISTTTCGFSNHFFAYFGGNGDGGSSEELSQTVCGVPAHFYAYFGGSNDGSGSETISETACAIPAHFYAYFGGEGNGYSLDATAPICPTAPPVADFTASATTVCVGQTITFTDTSTNIPSAWIWTLTGATPNGSTDQNPTVTYNTPGTYAVTLVAANFNGNDTEAKTGYITVTAIPTVTGTTPGNRCDAGTVTLAATASAGTLSWFADPSGGNALGTGTSFMTPNISGTTTYYVEAVSGICSSSRIAVIATINTTPTITATTPENRCNAGPVTLTATASEGNVVWYAAETGGMPLSTGNTFVTPSIPETTTYYVEAATATCNSPRTAVIATVNTTPSITATIPNGRCDAGTVSLQATTNAGTLSWYDVSTGGTALGTGATFATPIISGTTTYYVEATTATCTSPRSAVIATVTLTPTITSASPGNRCDTGTVTLFATSSSGNTVWYDVETGGTALATGNNFLTPTISSTTTYYVEAVNGSCISARTALLATVNTTPTVTTTTEDSRCGAGTVNLSATTSAGILNWYTAAVGGGFVGTGTSISPSVIGTTIFYVEATTGSCSSVRTPVTATVNTVPVITATTPDSRCDSGALLLQAESSEGILSWYDQPTGGTALATGTSFTTPDISATTVFYVEASNTSCTSTRIAVTATINPTPAPTGFANQSFCAGETVGLLGILGSNVVWYDAPSAGNIVADNTLLEAGATYYASQTLTACESPTRFAVTVTLGTCLGNEAFEWNAIQVYPNPTSGTLNVSGTQPISKVEVYNMLGQHIQSKNSHENQLKMDLSAHADGTYLVRVFIDGQTKTYKVIKK